VTVGECTQYTDSTERAPCRPSGVREKGKESWELCIAYEGGLFLIESSYMWSWMVIREGYARMMGVRVGFPRENYWRMETWAARMGYLWFCAVARNKTGGNGMQTIVPPEWAYVDHRR
jgi:hypothetical protein